ncbi:ABC transporter permease [Aerococcaceae bacterium DSM 111022]|nr:ABC transporter permease [Aerococcaceae bacterium DSM 111022]MBG9988485.1 ABC transporter permease [Aerococcaceae bacterium DSM 111176]
MNTITEFFANYGGQAVELIMEHIYISAISLIIGAALAIPIGVLLTRIPDNIANFIIALVSVLQTLPSLALLALMIPLFGIGTTPAIVALIIYSLLPILGNTYRGIKGVEYDLIDAAKGMGMTDFQLLTKVELPQAAPVIMAGVRLSATYVIAWATLASYIGAGGLGDFIFTGMNLYQPDLIIAGTIPVILLSLIADFILRLAENKVTPMNLK